MPIKLVATFFFSSSLLHSQGKGIKAAGTKEIAQ